MLSQTTSREGAAPADPAGCAGSLKDWGGILILDQADRLAPETEAFLGAVLARLDGACRVVVTARAGGLAWLPAGRSVVPDALPLGARAELGRRWADASGARFDIAEFHALLFFSGGRPGMTLLLLGAAHELIDRREATADDIASWLHTSDWDRVAQLASDPGPGLPSIGALVDEMVRVLSSICDAAELAMVRVFSRFQVCCEEGAAARLMTTISGSEVPVETASRVMGKLAAAGLVTRVVGAIQPAWFLHPLLKLVASRLPAADDPDDDALQGAIIDTVSQACADLAAEFRSDTVGVVDMLANHEQNMSDSLYFALEREQLEAAAHLAEGLCLHCRFAGDVRLLGRVLDHTLPHFIDTWTGSLRPECSEIGLRVWDQAIWLSPDWPRNRNPMRQGLVRLVPPENDHYAAGLWLRAIDRPDNASVAFRMELDGPSTAPRYAPGDIECQLSETVHDPDQPDTWPDALRESRQSYAARLPSDALGRAWSRISEARIRLDMVFDREDYQVDDEDVTARIALIPEDLTVLDEIADLLREAESEAGGRNAENRSRAAMLWSRIMLARGDLTSAIGYFEEGAQIMIDLEDVTLWSHYWVFALNLLHHGWVTRSYETAVTAFHFAMQTGDPMLPTRIREFCQQLEANYPELAS